MSCNTNFSKKCDTQPSEEEIRKMYLKSLTDDMDYYLRFVNDCLNPGEAIHGDKKECESYIRLLKRVEKIISNPGCTISRVSKICDSLCIQIKGDFSLRTLCMYEDCYDTLDNCFRYTYCSDELISLNETLEFINTNESKIAFYPSKEVVVEKLKIFWESTPNGRITFD